MDEIYLINLSSNNAGCGIKINDMLIMDNENATEGCILQAKIYRVC